MGTIQGGVGSHSLDVTVDESRCIGITHLGKRAIRTLNPRPTYVLDSRLRQSHTKGGTMTTRSKYRGYDIVTDVYIGHEGDHIGPAKSVADARSIINMIIWYKTVEAQNDRSTPRAHAT